MAFARTRTVADRARSIAASQTFVGHKLIKITCDVYGHLLEHSRGRARGSIGAAFSAKVYQVTALMTHKEGPFTA